MTTSDLLDEVARAIRDALNQEGWEGVTDREYEVMARALRQVVESEVEKRIAGEAAVKLGVLLLVLALLSVVADLLGWYVTGGAFLFVAFLLGSWRAAYQISTWWDGTWGG